ncbi:hypothetical protein LVJ84_06635 [Kingella potus]|nr:hypothetical protein LVJ84_06635 [Kingella potus]
MTEIIKNRFPALPATSCPHPTLFRRPRLQSAAKRDRPSENLFRRPLPLVFTKSEQPTMNLPLPSKSAPRTRWPNLTAGSLPYFLTQHLHAAVPKVILTTDTEQALRLQTAWQFFRPQDNALFLPDWETLPYERFSPHQDLVSERLAALWQLKNRQADVLIVPVATAMQYLAPVPFLLGRTFWLKTGQTVDVEAMRGNLVEAGYSHVSNVVAAGEFAVRGGIVDIFPMGAAQPYRLDLFGDEIDSIKTFDPDSQRTLAPVSEIRLLPAHEFPTDADAQKIFRTRFREEIDGDYNAAVVYKAVSSGTASARAWNITCRCFSKTAAPRCSTTFPPTRWWCAWATYTPKRGGFGPT